MHISDIVRTHLERMRAHTGRHLGLGCLNVHAFWRSVRTFQAVRAQETHVRVHVCESGICGVIVRAHPVNF